MNIFEIEIYDRKFMENFALITVTLEEQDMEMTRIGVGPGRQAVLMVSTPLEGQEGKESPDK